MVNWLSDGAWAVRKILVFDGHHVSMVLTRLLSRFGIFVSLLAVRTGDSSDELTLRMISSSTRLYVNYKHICTRIRVGSGNFDGRGA